MRTRIVVSALIEQEGKILLGRKKPGVGPYPDTWHLPGGGIEEEDKTLEEALQREVREETGLEVAVSDSIGFDEDLEPNKEGEETHYIFLVHKTRVSGGTLKPSSDLVALQWFPQNELKNLPLTMPSQKLFIKMGIV
ncbi:MAG: NUDIX domain-containing protein [Patescibacteria group bacterium]